MEKVAVMLAEGFEEGESLFVVDILRRAGFDARTLSIAGEIVKGARDIEVVADEVFSGSLDGYSMVVIPGGMPGAANLAACAPLVACLRERAQAGALVASICAGPMALDAAGLLSGRRFTCFPTRKDSIGRDGTWVDEPVVRDANIITSQGPGTTLHFAYALVDALGGDGSALAGAMLYTKVVSYA